MRAAHLRAVPDLAPDEETTELGERSASAAPLLAPVTPDTAKDNGDADTEDVCPDTDTAEGSPADQNGRSESEAEAEEAPAPSVLALPNLRPYYDIRPLAELGPLAVEVGRGVTPHLRTGFAASLQVLRTGSAASLQVLGFYWRGLRTLTTLGIGWLSGTIGKGGSIGARIGILAFTGYCVVQLIFRYPATPYIGAALLLITLPLTAKKSGDESEKKQKGTTGKSSSTGTQKQHDSPTPQKEKKRKGLRGLFTGQKGSAGQAPAEPAQDAREEAPEDLPEPPREDPLTALIREAIGADNGVHLSVLRPLMRDRLPGLSSATDEELRKALVKAGYDPSRKFRARGIPGRAGVHRKDLPPLPSPDSPSEALSAPLSTPGERLDLRKSPPPETRGERGEEPQTGGEEWTKEQRARGFRCVPDPERGPSASKIERLR